jgi:hypothetical protein
MESSEIVDLVLAIYRTLGWTFLRTSAAPALFVLAAIAFLVTYVGPNLGVTQSPQDAVSQVGESGVLVILGFVVAGPLALLGLTFSSAVVVRLVSGFLLGSPVSESDAQSLGSRLIGRLFLLGLRELFVASLGIAASLMLMFGGGLLAAVTPEGEWLSAVLALFGVFGVIAGGIWFLVVVSSHALAVPIMILEDLPPAQSAKRSGSLMGFRKHLGSGSAAIWGLYSLLFIAGLIVWGGGELVMNLLGLRAVIEEQTLGWTAQPVVLAVLQWAPIYAAVVVLVPAWAAACTVIYYERRVRVEGFDIEVLAQDAS